MYVDINWLILEVTIIITTNKVNINILSHINAVKQNFPTSKANKCYLESELSKRFGNARDGREESHKTKLQAKPIINPVANLVVTLFPTCCQLCSQLCCQPC